MAFEISNAGSVAASKTNIEPNLVLSINGVDTRYGARTIRKIVQIGDSGLTIGSFIIGALNAVADQSSLIKMSDTTTQIKQSINPDRGISQSISSMKVALIDKDLEASELITPDESTSPAFDILGRKATVWLGFEGTSFKRDYVVIFRGIIDDIEAGAGEVILNLAHPSTKARTEAFQKAETELNGSLTDSATSMTVVDTTDFLSPYTAPGGVDSDTIKYYVRIDDEIIQYESTTGTTFATLTRGALGTTAAAHDDEAKVESFYRLTGDACTLALKILLSGKNGAFATGVAVTNFVNISTTETVANAVFFKGIDLERDYGLVTGDYITTTGATNGANDFTNRTIENIVVTSTGSYLVASGSALVSEFNTSATISFRSQYDTLGEGLGLDPDEVDVPEFEDVLRLYLSSFNYDFYLKDKIVGKDFIEEQILNPAGAYGLPRKSQFSLGIHAPPLPGSNTPVLDSSNVLNPGRLKIRRTTSLNFQNTVSYSFDERPLEDKFDKIVVTTDATSATRIPVGVKALNIQSKGMRTSLSGTTLASAATSRRLDKYKYGAEFIENVRVNFKTGFPVEVGDVVLVDLASLQITDIKQGGTRAGAARLFQVDNKSMNLKGDITLKLTDTNFAVSTRYGTISPASLVKSGSSNTTFVIKESFRSIFGANEYKKWEFLIGASIKVRNASYSTSGTGILESVVGNTITLESSLGFTPSADMVMELDVYDNQPARVKLVYAFFSDGSNNFADGGIPYELF